MPKSRAKLRGRLDRTKPEPEPERARLLNWIERWAEGRRGELASLDLGAYLSETSCFDLDAGERLRLLAVHLDDQCLVAEDNELNRWEVFSRIYEAARQLAPRDPVILQSMTITVLRLAAGLRRGDDDHRRLVTIAKRASAHAVEFDETDADLHYTYGSALYVDDAADPEEALEAFDAALARDPAHAWSLLYRAHCLHDLERWSEAADAYARVKHSDFVGHRAWRMELLREQRASCLLHAGRFEEGIALAEDVVRRREKALASGGDWLRSPALHEPPRLLVEAAANGWLPDELRARLEATVTANDERWLLDGPEG